MVQSVNDPEKKYYADKLAEIDFMLHVINKQEIIKQSEVYMTYIESQLKALLTKRLQDIAQAEIYRDLSEEEQLQAS